MKFIDHDAYKADNPKKYSEHLEYDSVPSKEQWKVIYAAERRRNLEKAENISRIADHDKLEVDKKYEH